MLFKDEPVLEKGETTVNFLSNNNGSKRNSSIC